MYKIYFCIFLIKLCFAANLVGMDPPKRRDASKDQYDLKEKINKASMNGGSLEMVEEPVSDEDVREIAAILDYVINSLSLRVSGACGVNQIAAKLADLQRVSKLKIIADDIDIETTLALIKAIENNKSLTHLAVIFTNLDNEALISFTTAVAGHENLKFVSFSGDFTEIGIIGSALKIRNWGLEQNGIETLELITKRPIPQLSELLKDEAWKVQQEGSKFTIQKVKRRWSAPLGRKNLINKGK